MSNRIPPKGTKGYVAYYQDKRILADLKQMREIVEGRAKRAKGYRRDLFQRATRAALEAERCFHTGWEEAYTEDSE